MSLCTSGFSKSVWIRMSRSVINREKAILGIYCYLVENLVKHYLSGPSCSKRH